MLDHVAADFACEKESGAQRKLMPVIASQVSSLTDRGVSTSRAARKSMLSSAGGARMSLPCTTAPSAFSALAMPMPPPQP
jgi:hypothetical protein